MTTKEIKLINNSRHRLYFTKISNEIDEKKEVTFRIDSEDTKDYDIPEGKPRMAEWHAPTTLMHGDEIDFTVTKEVLHLATDVDITKMLDRKEKKKFARQILDVQL